MVMCITILYEFWQALHNFGILIISNIFIVNVLKSRNMQNGNTRNLGHVFLFYFKKSELQYIQN